MGSFNCCTLHMRLCLACLVIALQASESFIQPFRVDVARRHCGGGAKERDNEEKEAQKAHVKIQSCTARARLQRSRRSNPTTCGDARLACNFSWMVLRAMPHNQPTSPTHSCDAVVAVQCCYAMLQLHRHGVPSHYQFDAEVSPGLKVVFLLVRLGVSPFTFLIGCIT